MVRWRWKLDACRTGAVIRAGLDPALKLNGVEMINALAKRYEDDVDAAQAAAGLGRTKDEFAQAAADADRRFKPLLRRLEQGLVPRDQFETAFKALAKDATNDAPVETAGAGIKDAAAKPAHSASLPVTSDKDSYRQGDTPAFTVLSSADCFLTLTNVGGNGEGTVLFPNKFRQDNRIRANVEFQFPAAGAPFQYRMKDRGFETVIGVCTGQAAGADGVQHDFGKTAFTIVGNYTRSVTRVIAVEAKNPADGAASPQSPSVLKTVQEISRAAIKVEVR